jgi:ABC-type nitrate/sulfonate/bicarbonate transport system permease component
MATVAGASAPEVGARSETSVIGGQFDRPPYAATFGATLRVVGRAWPALAGLVALIGIWEIVVKVTGLDATVLPSPGRVAHQGWSNRGLLWSNAVPTVKETVIGMLCALGTSAILATVIDFSRICRRAVYPLLVISQSVPVIVVAPLFVIWFGFGLLPKVLVIVLVTFFPTTVSLLEGFAASDEDAGRLLRSMGASRLQIFTRLRVPTALPYFFTGLRVAVSFAVMAAIFGEWVGAYNGLGIFMELQKNALRTDLVFAAIVVTALVSITLYGLTFVLQAAVMPWYRRSDAGHRRDQP